MTIAFCQINQWFDRMVFDCFYAGTFLARSILVDDDRMITVGPQASFLIKMTHSKKNLSTFLLVPVELQRVITKPIYHGITDEGRWIDCWRLWVQKCSAHNELNWMLSVFSLIPLPLFPHCLKSTNKMEDMQLEFFQCMGFDAYKVEFEIEQLKR